MVNKAGKTVQPTVEAFQAAASNADWAKAPGYYVILTDQPGEESWPITAATFILMHKEPADKAASAGSRSSSSNGPSTRAARWPKSSTTSRCRTAVVKLIEKTWSADIKS